MTSRRDGDLTIAEVFGPSAGFPGSRHPPRAGVGGGRNSAGAVGVSRPPPAPRDVGVAGFALSRRRILIANQPTSILRAATLGPEITTSRAAPSANPRSNDASPRWPDTCGSLDHRGDIVPRLNNARSGGDCAGSSAFLLNSFVRSGCLVPYLLYANPPVLASRTSFSACRRILQRRAAANRWSRNPSRRPQSRGPRASSQASFLLSRSTISRHFTSAASTSAASRKLALPTSLHRQARSFLRYALCRAVGFHSTRCCGSRRAAQRVFCSSAFSPSWHSGRAAWLVSLMRSAFARRRIELTQERAHLRPESEVDLAAIVAPCRDTLHTLSRRSAASRVMTMGTPTVGSCSAIATS